MTTPNSTINASPDTLLSAQAPLTPVCCLAVRSSTMYAKSFIALDGNGRHTWARTAQRYLQHRRSELAKKLLLQYRIVLPRLYKSDTAALAGSSMI